VNSHRHGRTKAVPMIRAHENSYSSSGFPFGLG
jgi:hypothetical protein